MRNADYDKDIISRFIFYWKHFIKNGWEAITDAEIHAQLAREIIYENS